MIKVRAALARSVRGIDFAGGREDQERTAIEVHVRVLFNLLHGFDNRRLPSARTCNLVKGFLRHLSHPVLIYTYHLRYVLSSGVPNNGDILLSLVCSCQR
jgi:hypothetical protein